MSARVLCLGEVLLRLSAPGHERLLQSSALTVHVGGAEANVGAALAQLGHRVSMLSVLPTGPLGDAALGELARIGVDVSSVSRVNGRMGLYFFEQGAIRRASEVVYDRAGSAFAQATEAQFDWDQAMAGADHLHLSGVTPALGPESARLAVSAARAARKHGLRVSVDGNFRAKLWQAWGGDAASWLRELFGQADVLFGNHRDLELVLGGDYGRDPERAFERAAVAAFEAFPNLQWIAGTLRIAEAVTQQQLGGLMAHRSGELSRSAPAPLEGIVDRIGAGDAFAAGILHGLRRGLTPQTTLDFGLACAGLKHTIPGDFLRANEADVLAWISAQGADVRR